MARTDTVITTDELRERADRLPRVRLAHLPTPLEELPRLAAELGGPRVFIKRDDCTGLAFGGNKTRHGEFLLGEAVHQQAQLVVWGAGVQSNNCRQTAAACAKLGLDIHLVLSRANHAEELQGNMLLDHIVGASYEVVDAAMGHELDAAITERADRYRAQGIRVYEHTREMRGRAAVSYVLCMAELLEQLAAVDVQPRALFVSAAGATGAGLALGRAVLGAPFEVRSILPIRWEWDEAEDIAAIANQAAALLGLDTRLSAADISCTGDYVGDGYGIPSSAGMDAMALVARNEGVLLDPSYTSKAMAALIDDARGGGYGSDDAVVFVHTGGLPALFAYHEEIQGMISRRMR